MHDMQDRADDDVIVCRARTEQQCAELALVLTACGIDYQRYPDSRGEWLLSVPAAQAERAVAELAEYRAEHAGAPRTPPPLAEFAGAWSGVAAYAATLMAIAICARQYAFGFEWLRAGRLDAGRVLDGEWWRAVTALTLHVDITHLAGNLGFGGFFGYFIGRYFGPGVAWFAILCAGASGNVLNALIQSPDHLSIGASTAVFGALGLLTAHTWRRGLTNTSWRARIAPLIAGISLLAFTGTGGENTDIFAHLTGFVAGFGIGAVLARTAIPRAAALQAAFGGAACAVLVIAWGAALASAG